MGCACSGGSDPQPPVIVNPGATASAQATYNRDAALDQRALNMVDQHTPQGSVTYSPTGTETVEGIPDFSVTQSYSPEQQRLYDLSTGMSEAYGEIGTEQLGAVRSSLETPFSLESLGAAPTINEGTRAATRDAMIARLQPQMDRERAALETQLSNQGFQAGTRGWDTAFDEMNRRENDLFLGADAAAGAEMSREFGLAGTARDRAINELLMERQQPMSELATFATGARPTSPSFVSTPQGTVTAPDYMGAAYASAGQQQQNYAQQMANQRASLQGLYGLGGAGLMAGGMSGWKWPW